MANDYKPLPPLRGARYQVQLDEENRLYLNDEVRRFLGVPTGGSLLLSLTDQEEVYLGPLMRSCDFCGGTDSVVSRGGFFFCEYCLDQLEHGCMPEDE